MHPISDNQERTLAIIAKISGSLSIVGSSLIVRDVFKKWRKARGGNDHLPFTTRIVLNMCIADIGSSFWGHFMGPWMRYGNDAACASQAFLFTFFVLSAAWSNALLALSCKRDVCLNCFFVA